MSLNKEILEIIDYLSKKKNYAIFGGFASFLYFNIEPSNDIDIFTTKISDVREIKKDFTKKGWKEINKKAVGKKYLWICLKKRQTTFDVHFSKISSTIFIKRKINKKYKKYTLKVIGFEEMFISKIQCLIEEKRPLPKIKRDRKLISIIKNKINRKRLNQIFLDVPKEFWTKGYF